MARRLLAVGLTMTMGYTFGVLTLGGCAGAPWPSNGKLPEPVVDRLTDCGRKGPKPLESVSYDLTFTVHVTEDDQEARVDDVMLTGSTLHLPEVEACMRDALYGMRTPLSALALRRRQLGPDKAAPPAGALLGQVEVAVLLEVGVVFVVGFAAYTVVVHLIEDRHRTKQRSHPARPETAEPPVPAPVLSAATADPTATAAPTTTAVPVARRYPNQTCSDDELDGLEREKDKLCKSGYAATCGDPAKTKFAKLPCSVILLAIRQRQACLDARKLVQKTCFGSNPDAGHKTAIEQEENGIRKCETLKLANCAKGHPMAGQ